MGSPTVGQSSDRAEFRLKMVPQARTWTILGFSGAECGCGTDFRGSGRLGRGPPTSVPWQNSAPEKRNTPRLGRYVRAKFRLIELPVGHGRSQNRHPMPPTPREDRAHSGCPGPSGRRTQCSRQPGVGRSTIETPRCRGQPSRRGVRTSRDEHLEPRGWLQPHGLWGGGPTQPLCLMRFQQSIVLVCCSLRRTQI